MKIISILAMSIFALNAYAQKPKAKPVSSTKKVAAKPTATKPKAASKPAAKFVVTAADSLVLKGMADEYCACTTPYWGKMPPKAKEFMIRLMTSPDPNAVGEEMAETVKTMDSTEKATFKASFEFMNEQGEGSWGDCMSKLGEKEEKYFGKRRSSKDEKISSLVLMHYFDGIKDCELLKSIMAVGMKQ
jgi:hypothetical protein